MRYTKLLGQVLLCGAALPFLGCSAFEVKKDVSKIHDKVENKDVKGIPFFIKQAMYKHTTIYQITNFLVYVEVYSEEAPTNKILALKFVAVEGRWNATKRTEFTQAVTELLKENADALQLSKTITAAWERIYLGKTKEGESAKVIENEYPATTIRTNSMAREIIVDYSMKYHYNVTAPLFGIADTKIKLATDGTLTDVESKVDSTKLGEKLADLIPLKEFLTAKLISTQPKDKGGKKRLFANYTDEEKIYKHTFTRDYTYDAGTNILNRCKTELTVDGDCLVPLTKRTAQSMEITEVGKEPQPAAKEKDKEKKGIKFEGSVELPEK